MTVALCSVLHTPGPCEDSRCWFGTGVDGGCAWDSGGGAALTATTQAFLPKAGEQRPAGALVTSVHYTGNDSHITG